MKDPDRQARALQAKSKELGGGKLTHTESEDAKWYTQELVRETLSSCPRGFFAQLAGKQIKSLTDQHATYGIPTPSGQNIDGLAVLAWLYTFLAEWGPKIKRKKAFEEEKATRSERKEELEIKQLEMKMKGLAADLERKTGNAIPLEELRKLFSWHESEMRRLGERLGKRFGAESQTMFNATLTRMATVLDEACGNESSSP